MHSKGILCDAERDDTPKKLIAHCVERVHTQIMSHPPASTNTDSPSGLCLLQHQLPVTLKMSSLNVLLFAWPDHLLLLLLDGSLPYHRSLCGAPFVL